MAAKSEEAYVSLATNNHYCHGAIALGQSLRRSNTTRKLCVLVTEKVTIDMRESLKRVWDEVLVTEEITSGDEEKLALLRRPELGVTFTKLHAWRLVHYTKCVFLDADTLVLTNVDELFEWEEFSAAPDIGWPDQFNSGVFVFRPSLETFSALADHAHRVGSYDGGDQGLLNSYCSTWSTDNSRRLPFIYNVVANLTYSYPPAFKRFKDKIKIIHFLGSIKPWHHYYVNGRLIMHPAHDQTQYGAEEYIKQWWEMYNSAQLPPPETAVVESTAPPPAQAGSSDGERSWDRSDDVIAHINSLVSDTTK